LKSAQESSGKHSALATPAVRHLSKQLGIEITSISGTGKDGRVLKEDLQRYAQGEKNSAESPPSAKPLSPFQTQMFKTMTNSLLIPHFLFTDSISLNSLSSLRKSLKHDPINPASISPLPFFIKAISLALQEYPLLNSHLDTSGPQPLITQHKSHNFGIAIDTPAGLIVPVLRDVQIQNISSLSAQISDLASRARQGKLAASELKGATFTISNVGSIAGGVVAPVITAPQVGIVGIGRSKILPAFDSHGDIIKREEVTLSWSADHRIVDGAMVARAAELVKTLMEDIGKMLIRLK
jgi:2-oxoisovalerate dehydrogenase E2 component (dihydrolipoyl transacylase)